MGMYETYGNTAQLPADAFIIYSLDIFSVICKTNHTVIISKTPLKYIQYSCGRFVYSDEKTSARLNDNNYAV